MITITIKSETGHSNFSLTHESAGEKPSTELCSNITALQESLRKLLEKNQDDALENRLVRNLHALEANAHPSVREFARSALANLGHASPT